MRDIMLCVSGAAFREFSIRGPMPILISAVVFALWRQGTFKTTK
jgi:hypothetical protein